MNTYDMFNYYQLVSIKMPFKLQRLCKILEVRLFIMKVILFVVNRRINVENSINIKSVNRWQNVKNDNKYILISNFDSIMMQYVFNLLSEADLTLVFEGNFC